MVTAGRSFLSYIHSISILVALIGGAAGDGNVSSTPIADSAPPANNRVVSLDATCPARDWWEVGSELFQFPLCPETRWGRFHEVHTATVSVGANATTSGHGTSVVSSATSVSVSSGSSPTAATEQNITAEHEHDTDSLLDSASFLSFEDWKKQNLAKVGQSAENVGGNRRSAAAGKEGRRQPTGINNALDSLGDDAEIELEFGGFGAETPETARPSTWATPVASKDDRQVEGGMDGRSEDVHLAQSVQTDASRRKDAGTTCKERFNYASFDCAANVLKTNSECKGSSSVLIENKDSYMLNECRAHNKFLILELCDDILVDTVVLANYEFFSSIFHTFRVSVSDRYPAKQDQWKELGVYEARNTREIQAFAVENSLIWAKYLRIEFLTHYGHEFYCPVSLIRVHGTTMMEEYKHDEGVGRAPIDEVEEPVDAGQLPSELETEPVEPPVDASVSEEKTADSQAGEVCLKLLSEPELLLLGFPDGAAETCGLSEVSSTTTTVEATASSVETRAPSNVNATAATGESFPSTPPSHPVKAAEDTRKTGESAKVGATASSASTVASESTAQTTTSSETTGKAATNPKEECSAPSPESTRPTNTQPPSPNPTTQESFFKSVHKRLQMLESNSTLSLLYIEEQSRILRDAFNKVEKRQLSKTSTFLENLNVTVLNELKQFREQYDSVWRSVVFEFEHQRIQYHQEVQALSGQLGVLADELVFQKRVTVIQSIMVLCCFALVLFSRSSVGNYMEFPSVQRMVARSHSLRSSSTFFSSPSASPGSTRPASSHRNKAAHHIRNLSDHSSSSSSSSHDGCASPTVAYIPPTPTSQTSGDLENVVDHGDHHPVSLAASGLVPTPGTPQVRPQSTPPVLSGRMGDVVSDTDDDDDGEDQPGSGLSNPPVEGFSARLL